MRGNKGVHRVGWWCILFWLDLMLRSRLSHLWQLFLLASYVFAYYISLLFASLALSLSLPLSELNARTSKWGDHHHSYLLVTDLESVMPPALNCCAFVGHTNANKHNHTKHPHSVLKVVWHFGKHAYSQSFWKLDVKINTTLTSTATSG